MPSTIFWDYLGMFSDYGQKNIIRNKKFYNAKSIKKAYLTDFFNFLIEHKITIRCINIKRNWMEIDTKQDLKKAENFF